MDTHQTPPIHIALDDSDEPADVIDALLLGPFAAGLQPAARSARLERVRPDAPLFPVGASATRTAAGNGRRAVLAEGKGWTLRAMCWSDACATVTVVAETDELAASVLAQAIDGACEPVPDDGLTIPIAFWHRRCDGQARRTGRQAAATHWPKIRANYPPAAASALEQVMALRPDEAGGRLLLLHGPPGTGKTTALRAIGTAWRQWCRTEVVIDSEQLYGDAGYLTAVMLGRDEDEDHDGPSGAWRLLVLEDCDELIRDDAKRQAGQALGRLLNMTDGLIGQGLKLLVAITTNEPLGVLHPAIVRPGRCMAEIHVGPFSRSEAAEWLGAGNGGPAVSTVPAGGATLAELYALRGTVNPVRARELRSVAGMYL